MAKTNTTTATLIARWEKARVHYIRAWGIYDHHNYVRLQGAACDHNLVEFIAEDEFEALRVKKIRTRAQLDAHAKKLKNRIMKNPEAFYELIDAMGYLQACDFVKYG